MKPFYQAVAVFFSFGSLCANAEFSWKSAKSEIIAGSGQKGYAADQTPAKQAALADPFGAIIGPDGLLYFCEFHGHVVRRITKNGKLQTIAGIPGKAGYTGDGGPATQGTLDQPHEIRFDSTGDLYISDMRTHTIRKVEMKTGILRTYAGNGTAGYSGDGGPASQAQLNNPISIQFDPQGNLWICDIQNQRLRRVDAKSGHIETVCGTGKKQAPQDGDLLAPTTPLQGPRGIDFDSKGYGWLALREGHSLYQFSLKDKLLKRVVGTGKAGPTEDGALGTATTLNGPKGISPSPDGKIIFIANTENHEINAYDVASGRIHRVLGNGKRGLLARPHGVYAAADGALYIGDSENHVVLRLK